MTLREKIQLMLSGIPNIFASIPPYYRRDIEAAAVQAVKELATEKLKDERHIDDVSFLHYQEQQPEKRVFEEGYKAAWQELLEETK